MFKADTVVALCQYLEIKTLLKLFQTYQTILTEPLIILFMDSSSEFQAFVYLNLLRGSVNVYIILLPLSTLKGWDHFLYHDINIIVRTICSDAIV